LYSMKISSTIIMGDQYIDHTVWLLSTEMISVRMMILFHQAGGYVFSGF